MLPVKLNAPPTQGQGVGVGVGADVTVLGGELEIVGFPMEDDRTFVPQDVSVVANRMMTVSRKFDIRESLSAIKGYFHFPNPLSNVYTPRVGE
jgi:hypothetical protein